MTPRTADRAEGSALTLSAMTVRTAGFEDRVRAAAAAGFEGIGVGLNQYRAARAAGLTDRDMVRMTGDAGLQVTEVEGPWDWTHAATRSTEDDDTMAHLAGVFGGPQITLVQFARVPEKQQLAAVAAWCVRAAELHATVAVEFVPFSEIATLADACRIIDGVDRPELGVVIDCWHWVNAPGSAVALAGLAPGNVSSIQLNDPLPVASDDLRDEARHRRQLPGLRSLEMLRALRAHGVQARLAVELWSDVLEQMPPELAARQAYESARLVLGEFGTA